MTDIDGNVVLIGASELRSKFPNFQNKLKGKTVVVMNRGKPVAVLQDFDEYKQKQDLMNSFEDLVLGYMAKGRMKGASKKKFVSHSEMKKRYKMS